MPRPGEVINIILPFARFERMVCAALEKDNGTMPIADEILRLCKVAMHKISVENQWTKNLRGIK